MNRMLGSIQDRLACAAYRSFGGPEVRALGAADLALIRRVRGQRLTYLSVAKLGSLLTTSRRLEAEQVPGVFIEAGCALGGSTIVLAKSKQPQRPLQVYDVFGMIPPPTEADTEDVHARYQTIVAGQSAGIGGDLYYGYRDDLYEAVGHNLSRHGVPCEAHAVSLIRGRLEDTLVVDQPVALAHIDVDWYQPVRACLERILPRLSPGGTVIIDDYHDWGGCRKAVDAYLAEHPGPWLRDDSAGSLKLTRPV